MVKMDWDSIKLEVIKIMRMTTMTMERKIQTINDAIDEIVNGTPREIYPIFLDEINPQIGGGLISKSLNLMVAASGLGKSNLAINTAVKLAKSGVPTVYFSTELATEDVLARSLAIDNDDSMKNYEYSTLYDNRENILKAKKKFNKNECFFYEKTRVLEDIIELAQWYKVTKGVKVIFIDHVHCLDTREKTTSEFQKDDITIRNLINLWEEDELCVVAVAQPAKSSNKGIQGDKENIRGTAHWYYLASTFFYLFESAQQKEYNDSIAPGEYRQITMQLSKVRKGNPVGGTIYTHMLRYRPWKAEFVYGGEIKRQDKTQIVTRK
jgi:archaellum biogenesis ATPase FlaH